MKPVAFFFLFLLSYLAGICNYAPLGDNSSKIIHSKVSGSAENLSIENSTTKHNLIQTENTGLNGERAFEFSIEDDDEDIIEKHISLVKYTLAFSHAFAQSYRSSCNAQHFPVYNYIPYISSCKYIVQRALRL
ncbi:hypothetical protein [Segetibacter aerophilus]|uniref:hypothetical protein n=1 Tax=Segetibacter aerophilus TaxID=670293 RepID=UPI0011BED809|nr:hypothetical protein [Segetibacter aerophilus]